MNNLLSQINQELATLSDAVLASLVQVINRGRGAGTGTIWQSDGVIVTNAHVVQDRHGHAAPGLTVRLHDGRERTARVLAVDGQRDLAALQVDQHHLSAMRRGDSRNLKPGDMVVAMGFPFGIQGGATTGIVIGSGTNLPEIRDRQREWIAASLHLRPGHSGGPMVDSDGCLIGVNTLMSGPEVGVAIPVHVVEEFMRQVLQQRATLPPDPAAPIHL